MAPSGIIDSHIHLWPASMSNEEGHSWMTPGMPLSKEQLLDHYLSNSHKDSSGPSEKLVDGVIYVETDVRYEQPSQDLRKWAKGPLDEILFLRSIVEGQHGERDERLLVGIVLWAPMDQPPSVLKEWLGLAEATAGPKTWGRVKGFRFLLQAIHDQERFERLVNGDNFTANLKILGQRRFSFDVGVDQNSGGVWQLEAVGRAMHKVHEGVPEDEKVAFIINHLCKPNFSTEGNHFERWSEAIESMSKCSKTYMKLSGAFSELPSRSSSMASIAQYLRPWAGKVLHVLEGRVMFGSDWPVCNVKGPRGEHSWSAWRDVVEEILDDPVYELSEEAKEEVWRGAASKAYRLGPE